MRTDEKGEQVIDTKFCELKHRRKNNDKSADSDKLKFKQGLKRTEKELNWQRTQNSDLTKTTTQQSWKDKKSGCGRAQASSMV